MIASLSLFRRPFRGLGRTLGLAAILTAAASTALAAGASAPATAVGLPVRLADPAFTPFTGRSLVVTDLDAANGPDLAGIEAANIVIKFRQSDGTFPTQQSLPMGFTLSALESADLDGDTRPDLVAVSTSGLALVSRLNLGGGNFAAPVSLPTGGGTVDVALGDLNGDGRPDAVTALYDSAIVEVSLNDGAGNLQTPARLAVSENSRYSQIGDFTGDGRPDVLAVSYFNTCVITVLPGNGDGTFGAAIVSSAPLSYRLSISAGDLDGDGDRDLVAFHATGAAQFLNQGDGTFAAPVSLDLPVASYDSYGFGRLALGDVDHDGSLDVAIACRAGLGTWDDQHFFAVFINRGDATWFPPLLYHVGMYPQDAALADIDGDGWMDGVVTTRRSAPCCSSPSGSVPQFAFQLRNLGAGTFEAHLEVRDPVWLPLRIAGAPADLLGSSGGQLKRIRNRGNGTFLPAEALGRGFPWRARDLDGDGDDELLVTSSDSLWVLLGLGGGALSAAGSVHAGLTPRDLADFDHDGNPDLLATDAALQLQVLPGDGAGGLGAPVDYGFTLPESPLDGSTRGADVNADGFADLLYLPRRAQILSPSPPYSYAAWLHVALNDGAGHFGPVDSFAVQFSSGSPRGGALSDLAIGDFDGDSAPDAALLAAACGNDSPGWWGAWRGLGGGAFAPLGAGTDGGNSPCRLASGDLNGDGLHDLVRTNSNGGQTFRATVMAAQGAGTFATHGALPMGDYPDHVNLADIDGDGRLDVITRGTRRNTASIRRNLTEYDLPTPALLSLAAIHHADGAVYLDWFAGGDAPAGTKLERNAGASEWVTLAALTPDGTGHLYFIDRDLPAVERLGYRLRWRDETGEHLTAEHWVDLPAAEFALNGAWPNPSGSAPTIALVLPRPGSVEIEIFDVSGRKVTRETRTGLAAGPQRVALTAKSLEPGLYLARVSYSGQRLHSRFVVVR